MSRMPWRCVALLTKPQTTPVQGIQVLRFDSLIAFVISPAISFHFILISDKLGTKFLFSLSFLEDANGFSISVKQVWIKWNPRRQSLNSKKKESALCQIVQPALLLDEWVAKRLKSVIQPLFSFCNPCQKGQHLSQTVVKCQYSKAWGYELGDIHQSGKTLLAPVHCLFRFLRQPNYKESLHEVKKTSKQMKTVEKEHRAENRIKEWKIINRQVPFFWWVVTA